MSLVPSTVDDRPIIAVDDGRLIDVLIIAAWRMAADGEKEKQAKTGKKGQVKRVGWWSGVEDKMIRMRVCACCNDLLTLALLLSALFKLLAQVLALVFFQSACTSLFPPLA